MTTPDEASRDEGSIAATAVLAAAFGLAIAAYTYLVDPASVLQSDKELQLLPYYYEIGRLLQNGEWPFLTTRTMQGGFLLAEYQYGIFNPVSLLTYYLLPYVRDVYLAAALLNGLYLALLGAGACMLARGYGLGRQGCLLVGFSIAANGFVLYWLASSWFVGLVSLAWAVWAMASARQLVAAPSTKALLLFIVFSYLTVTAGFHFGDLALGVFVLFQAIWALRAGAKTNAGLIVLAFTAAVLLASPSLLPLLFAVGESLRTFGVTASVDMQVPLSALLTSSVPFTQPPGIVFGRESVADPGQYHIGWFIAPALALFGFAALWRHRALKEATALTAVFLLLTQLPDRFLYFEYPVRLLPYLALFTLIAGVGVMERGDLYGFARRNGDRVLIWLWLALFYLAVMGSNMDIRLLLAAFALIGGGSWYVLRLVRTGNRNALVRGALIVAMAIFLVQHALVPASVNMENLRTPRQQNIAEAEAFPPYVLTLSEWTTADKVYRPSATGLLAGERSLTGYGHINPNGLNIDACINAGGVACNRASRYFFRRETETGQIIADLAGIGRIVVRRGAAEGELARVITDEWVREQGNDRFAVYRRQGPEARPGTFTWASPGLRIDTARPFQEREERLEISANNGGGLVVFSRLRFAGYRASLNGRDLPVRSLAGMLTAVEVPDAVTGTLVLKHRYPMLPAALTAVILGVAIFAASVLLLRLNRAPPQDRI